MLAKYWLTYEQAYAARMRTKLGLLRVTDDAAVLSSVTDAAAGDLVGADDALVQELLAAMEGSGADFTTTMRSLAQIPMPAAPVSAGEAPTEPPEGCSEFLEAVLAQACSPKEAATLVGSRMHPHQLKMLQQLATREPAILISMGMSPAVRF